MVIIENYREGAIHWGGECGLKFVCQNFSSLLGHRRWKLPRLTRIREAGIVLFVDVTLSRIATYIEYLLTHQRKYDFSRELARARNSCKYQSRDCRLYVIATQTEHH